MAIFQGTRYADATVYSVADLKRGAVKTLLRREWDPEPPDGTNVRKVTPADSFHSIALNSLGDTRLWSVVADMNPSIVFPLDLPQGEPLAIPDASVAQNRRRPKTAPKPQGS